MLFPILMSRHY